MRRFGMVGLLVGLLALGVVGFTAYQLGVTAGTTSAAVASGATVVYAPMGIGFGFPLVGLLFGFLFLVLVIGAVGRIAFGRHAYGPGHGRGPWGNGGPQAWDQDERRVPPPFAAMLDRWHQDAHGTAATPPARSEDRPSGAPVDAA